MATDTKDPSARGNTAPQHLQSQTPSSENSTAPELAAAVDELLDQLQHKFDNVSTEIYGKLDDMARRLDELETSLNTSQEGSTAAKS
ncbi:heat shock factor binding protein 1-domain-containing protein [Talaromyces proteolyticus]|uniref:Heat shock factor binding protein 1-domain-containing protein n=1 Tax=Talaromyces proteolyticus TaxID=1131652 RepID=A0AAD4KNZ1_9EURO|nr:heat shock factor binding protein 1-domain-containing protein [Talaromyces proteolyticus]KAH8696204.1 heat shock factor binding protein 1-domain-containing protein [Talaromyces proteolyticus]